MNPGIAQAILEPPKNPQECLFSKMSTNFSADLTTRVEPCIFGGTPDCSQCGCVVSSGLHHVQQRKLVGPLSIGHLVRGSTADRLADESSAVRLGDAGAVADTGFPAAGRDRPGADRFRKTGVADVHHDRVGRTLLSDAFDFCSRPVERSSTVPAKPVSERAR